jgi:hypothetical protein
MSRFAPVAPLPVACALQDLGLLGNYHLLLAHDVLESPNNRNLYGSLYGHVVRMQPESCIIMDNSVVELQLAMQFEDVRAAAEVVAADYMVAADLFLDASETRIRSESYARDWYNAYSEGKYTPPLVGVIQGCNIRECLEVADYYASEQAFQAIAVPRCLVPMLGSRIPLLLELHKHYALRFKTWHLLGFSDNIWDDLRSASLPFVAGIDSAAPVRGAIAGKWLQLPQSDFGPRGDFWKTSTQETMASKEVMQYNLDLIRKLIAI